LAGAGCAGCGGRRRRASALLGAKARDRRLACRQAGAQSVAESLAFLWAVVSAAGLVRERVLVLDS